MTKTQDITLQSRRSFALKLNKVALLVFRVLGQQSIQPTQPNIHFQIGLQIQMMWNDITLVFRLINLKRRQTCHCSLFVLILQTSLRGTC